MLTAERQLVLHIERPTGRRILKMEVRRDSSHQSKERGGRKGLHCWRILLWVSPGAAVVRGRWGSVVVNGGFYILLFLRQPRTEEKFFHHYLAMCGPVPPPSD